MLLQIFMVCFVSSAVVPTILTHPTSSLSISHGDIAASGAFPYQVAIFAQGTYFCGGTIIDENNVLTAAHCICDRNNKPFRLDELIVKAGSNDLNSTDIQTFTVIKLRSNNYFNRKTSDYDVALIRVSPPFNFTNAKILAPVGLETNTAVFEGVKCEVAGWGVLEENSTTTTTVLRHAQVTLIDTKICKNSYRPLNTVTKRMLCAGSSNHEDACAGDSGGGLICDGKVTGIVSWGIGCGIQVYPTVYTKVAYFKHFINKHR